MLPGNGYRVSLQSLASREAKIRASVDASKETRDFFDFRNQPTKLPFVRLPEDCLVYRMENFRTYIDQNEYIVRERKASDLFSTGQENESVQQLQHEFLAKLARQGRADSVTPVIDVLKNDKQREPLLVTNRGVVVNGNRRLAAMRELLAENKAAFSAFSYVDCLVLPPDATASEIVDIEAALQAKPETRLDYDWIGDCQLIQRLLNLGRSVEQVAQRLNRKSTEVSNSLAALTEADLYLKEWRRAPGQYRHVLEAEQLFKDLPGLLENKSPALQDASRAIAWNLLENKGKLGSRLYAFNPVFGKNAERVMAQVATALEIPLVSPESSDESFAVEIEDGDTVATYQPIIEALRDPTKKEEAIGILIEASRDVVENERNKKEKNSALRAVTAAYARLSDVNLGAAEASTHAKINETLDKIIERANGMKTIISKLRDKNSS